MVYTNLIHRLVLIISLCIALLTFIINVLREVNFFSAAFTSLCVMFITGIIFLIAFKAIEKILYRHLHEQHARRKALECEETEEELS